MLSFYNIGFGRQNNNYSRYDNIPWSRWGCTTGKSFMPTGFYIIIIIIINSKNKY